MKEIFKIFFFGPNRPRSGRSRVPMLLIKQQMLESDKTAYNDTSYIVLIFLLVSIRIAVIVKPTAQMTRSTVLLKA